MISPIARVGAVLVLAAGAGAVGVASARSAPAGSPPAASGSSAAAAARPHAKHGWMARHALHGEFVVGQRGGTRTLAVQRGVLTAVAADSVTLRSRDGYVGTYRLDARTRVRGGGHVLDRSALQAGRRAAVVAVKDGGSFTALRVSGVRDAAPRRPLPATPGGTPGPQSSS